MFVHIIFIQRAYIGTYCHREVSSESALQAWPIFSKKYVCAGPANTFGGKNLLISTLDKIIYYIQRNIFTGLNKTSPYNTE
jgi:hypothetical protein